LPRIRSIRNASVVLLLARFTGYPPDPGPGP
jgi:hypothetical protein